MKYRLTESRLRGMIRESVRSILSEATSTPPRNDAQKFTNLEYGSINNLDYMRQDKNKLTDIYGNNDFVANGIDSIEKGFEQVIKGVNLLYKDRANRNLPYLDKMADLASRGLNINKLLKNKMKMKLGLQPNVRYDIEHPVDW